MKSLVLSACVVVVFLAASQEQAASAQATANLCCYITPPTSTPQACSIVQGSCPAAPDSNTAAIAIPSTDGNGTGQVTMNTSMPYSGLCFTTNSRVPDYCLTFTVSQGFTEDTTREATFDLPVSYAWSPQYTFCIDKASPLDECPSGYLTDLVETCCADATLVNPQFGSILIVDSQPLQLETPKPVPAVPTGVLLGMGATMLGLGLATFKAKRHAGTNPA